MKDNQEIVNFLMSQVQIHIDEECFKNCKKIKHITIPSYVTSIGNNTFYGCSSLRQISFQTPSSLTSIG